MTLDAATIRVLLAVARHVEREGLGSEALDALADAHVDLVVDWHPTVVDAWRATVSVGGRSAPLAVDADAAVAAVRALRAAVVHGVGNDRPVLHALPEGRGPRPSRPRRRR